MNVSHDGTTVSFKTEPEEVFLAEKSGTKPNTVRIIDNDEYEMLNTHTPKKIIIRYKEERFLRTLTNLHFAKLFGKVIVIFSWAHEEHQHSISNTSYAHTMSIGQLNSFENTLPGPHSVPIEPAPHNAGLQQEAVSPAETCQAVEEPSIDEKFHAITISTQTLAILQDLAHGQSIDRAIRVLHECYLNRKTSTWRPRHE